MFLRLLHSSTAHKKSSFFIKDFFRCDQIRRKLRIWSHLLKKSLMETFIFLQSSNKRFTISNLRSVSLISEWPFLIISKNCEWLKSQSDSLISFTILALSTPPGNSQLIVCINENVCLKTCFTPEKRSTQQPGAAYLYTLKTSKNLRFSDVFGGYR